MRCPYCQNPLQAGAPECSACRLTFPRASSLLGAVPRLSQTLADTLDVLLPAEHTRIRKRAGRIHWRFPQLTLQIVIHTFPPPHPLPLHTFWLFNAGAFASGSKRGKNNHAILLVVDPDRAEAALMPGYGLEELLHPDALGHLLELAGPAWAHQQWQEGILRVLDGLDQLLETAAIPRESGPANAAEF